MRDAAEFPFDASKYAFRTNFDGLTASDENMQTHVTKAAQNYKEALKKFESDHKEAREQYSKDKEEGMTEDEFKDWVGQNYPSWHASMAELSGASAKLTRTASDTFGAAYNENLEKEQSALNQEGWKEGYQPYLF